MDEKTIRHRILKAANSVIAFLVVVALCVCGAYSVYTLWDNNRIYTACRETPIRSATSSWENLLS